MTDPQPPCGALTRSGEPCANPPVKGGLRCRMHGGASPQSKAAVARRQQETEARNAVARHALPLDIDPGTALLQEVCRAAGAAQWLRARIEELDPEALIYGERSIKHQVGRSVEGPVDVVTTETGPGVHLWWKLWTEERDRLARVCRDALAAGVAQRQVALQEQLGGMLADYARGLLDQLDLTPEARLDADRAALRQFDLVVGGLR